MQAAEVARIAQELAGHVRVWFGRTAGHGLDRLGGHRSELALAGGRDEQDRPADLATRLREAWEARRKR